MKQIVVVGGAGHVGLPLSLILAKNNFLVTIFDTSNESVNRINSGQMPFYEEGADNLLLEMLRKGNLLATLKPDCMRLADVVIVVIGTPVDEHLGPNPNSLIDTIKLLVPYLSDGQLVILRSTVFPGVSDKVKKMLKNFFPNIRVAYCPERIAEGKALEEIQILPQIVGVEDDASFISANEIFSKITVECVRTTFEEAELSKLFTNAWRYIKFAAANQFFMMANDYGVDFEKVRYAITYSYPRALDLPHAGFAAGPCLFKDTMQLSALNQQNFILGNASMVVNEGLPGYLVKKLEALYDLENLTVGILGAAFKANVDDIRSSLAYKLRKLLMFRCDDVLMCDPLVKDSRLVSFEKVIRDSDLLIIATPHSNFSQIETDKPIIDIWNLLGRGVKL